MTHVYVHQGSRGELFGLYASSAAFFEGMAPIYAESPESAEAAAEAFEAADAHPGDRVALEDGDTIMRAEIRT